MDSILVEGKLYKKASILAKEFRYTTDYIGQLCRAGKVDCQLVGRAWYVSEASLLKHKDARYKEARLPEKILKYNNNSSEVSDRISVTPRLKKVTAKQNFGTKFETSAGKAMLESKYFPDDGDLLPQPLKRIEPILPRKIEIDVPDAIKVKVVSEAGAKKLDFTDVPTVPLVGKIRVKDVEVDNESFAVVTKDDVLAVRASRPTEKVLDETELQTMKSSESIVGLQSKEVTANQVLVFRPKAIVYSEKTTNTSFLIPLSIVTASILFVFINLSFQKFEIDGTEVTATIMFSFENIKNLL